MLDCFTQIKMALLKKAERKTFIIIVTIALKEVFVVSSWISVVCTCRPAYERKHHGISVLHRGRNLGEGELGYVLLKIERVYKAVDKGVLGGAEAPSNIPVT